MSKPSSSGEVLKSIEPGDVYIVSERKGLWIKMESPYEGWLKLTDVKFLELNTTSKLSGLASGREASGNSVATSGARGLGSEALETSLPNFEQLQKLKLFKSTINSEQFFSKLQIRTIPQLIKPEKQSSKNNSRKK
ncbi:MAG: hypothetical protein ACJ0BQ_02405 [Coraliomargaritaceae bacterium]